VKHNKKTGGETRKKVLTQKGERKQRDSKSNEGPGQPPKALQKNGDGKKNTNAVEIKRTGKKTGF